MGGSDELCISDALRARPKYARFSRIIQFQFLYTTTSHRQIVELAHATYDAGAQRHWL